MTVHFVVECQYGVRHSQCRCPDANKAVRKIECPSPHLCALRAGESFEEPKHRKDVPPDSSPRRSL